MIVQLIDHTDDPEAKIGQMAAICYDADLSRESCIRRARQCKDKGHLATLRFAYATFNVREISRVCSHQLVRHPHLSYLQRSQRYCSEDDLDFVVPEEIFAGAEWHVYTKAVHAAHDAYRELLKMGIKKENARFVLPQSGMTELNITGNFQAWLDFINLRDDKAAQWEIRQVAQEIRKQLTGIAPGIFGG